MNFFMAIKYFCKEAATSFARNRLLSIATVTTVAICVFILGLAFLITLYANQFIDRLESNVEMVAFLDNQLSEDQIAAIESEIKKLPEVQSVTVISKDQSLEQLQKNLNHEDLGIMVGHNPLPNTLQIKARDARQTPGLAIRISNIYGIYKINYGQGIVEKLFDITKWVRNLSVFLILVLAFGAVFLIATNIRLAIFARRKEIYLMKLIGATNWFIRWPFFLEGMLMGLVGSIVAVLLLIVGYSSILKKIPTLGQFSLVLDTSTMLLIYTSLVIMGIFLGVLGTSISLNRFLDNLE